MRAPTITDATSAREQAKSRASCSSVRPDGDGDSRELVGERQLAGDLGTLVVEPIAPDRPAVGAGAGGRRRAPPVLAREPAAVERRERRHPDAQLLAGRQDPVLDEPHEEGVRRLLPAQWRPPVRRRGLVQRAEVVLGGHRRPHGPGLARADQGVQALGQGIAIDRRRHAMHEEDLHVVGAEAGEAGVERALQRRGREVRGGGGGVVVAVLGRDRHLVAARGDGLADDLLRLAVGVGRRRVERGDAMVEGPADDRDALVVVRVSPVAEGHGSQPQLRATRHWSCHPPYRSTCLIDVPDRHVRSWPGRCGHGRNL